MFALIALLVILGCIAGFIVGRQYTEREVKAIENAKKDKKKNEKKK